MFRDLGDVSVDRKRRYAVAGGRSLVDEHKFFPVEAVRQRRRGICQTGIIRIRFRAADFRLNRVIRLANTVKY